jgi:hypothetical protein
MPKLRKSRLRTVVRVIELLPKGWDQATYGEKTDCGTTR